MEIHIPAEANPSETMRGKQEEAQDLQRVRDILFGSQVQEIERRIQVLEDDWQAKMSGAREEAQKESEALESRLQEQMDSLKGELDSEKEERTKVLEDVSETARKSVKEIEERFTEVTDQMEEEKVDRTDLAQMFRHISSELGSERGTAKKAEEPEELREFQPDEIR